ncbi:MULTISPECIES: type II secretion system protein [unclassified Lebetimonas]|uniref:type II secretion system protein n=1 Tax=unclassified Lebetimonas TaxID=2648158 RepID=UPI0004641D7A|nr:MULTISPECIES: type II secretion system protein [unclassified Lebetimonas]
MNKTAFTMLEMIFVLVILGILAAVALPRYFAIGQQAHEANLISFVRTLNRTTGEDLWAKSISEGHHGDISYIHSIKDRITLPPEINGSDINLKDCNSTTEYNVIAESNVRVTQKLYKIECKDGTAKSAPYFRLIRVEDNKILVNRD